MIVVSRFEVPDGGSAAFLPDVRAALAALAQRPGFRRGRVARGLEEPGTWALVTEWESVGAYRRALSAYDVKLATAPLLALARDEAGAYEVLAAVDEAQPSAPAPGDRAR